MFKPPYQKSCIQSRIFVGKYWSVNITSWT